MFSWQVDLSHSTASFSSGPNNNNPSLNNLTLRLNFEPGSTYQFDSQSRTIIETVVQLMFPLVDYPQDGIVVTFKIKIEGEFKLYDEYQLVSDESMYVTRPINYFLQIDPNPSTTVKDMIVHLFSEEDAMSLISIWPTVLTDLKLETWTINMDSDLKSPSLVYFSRDMAHKLSDAQQPIPMGTKSILISPETIVMPKTIVLAPNLDTIVLKIDSIELYTFGTIQSKDALVSLRDSSIWFKMIGEFEAIPIHMWISVDDEEDVEVLLPKTTTTDECADIIAAFNAKLNKTEKPNEIDDWISKMKVPLLNTALKSFELSNIGFHLRRQTVFYDQIKINKLYFTVKHPSASYWINQIKDLLPHKLSFSIEDPQVSIDISYPLQNAANKSYISYTIDFWLKFPASDKESNQNLCSYLPIRFSKLSKKFDSSDANENRFELLISTEMYLTPVFTRRPDVNYGIAEYFKYKTVLNPPEQSNVSPPQLNTILDGFGIPSFIDVLPSVHQLAKSTNLQLMNIVYTQKDNQDSSSLNKYSLEHLNCILRLSEYSFDENIPLVKYFYFVDSQFSFEWSIKNRWTFSTDTQIDVRIPDTENFQCRINLAYTSNNPSIGDSEFQFSIENTDNKFTLVRLLNLVGFQDIKTFFLFDDLLHNLALTRFTCVCSSTRIDSKFKLRKLSATVNYNDSFTIEPLTFRNLSVTVDINLVTFEDNTNKYNISVNFTGILNSLYVTLHFDNSNEALKEKQVIFL